MNGHRSNQNGPAVSVVLPVYNRKGFLAAAFQSIAAQSVASAEVVVVDDGSTDGSDEAVAELARTSRFPVKYIRQANQGPYGARNTGVAAAAGDYIAFYDSDDIWLPEHLGTCVAALHENPDVDWVFSASEIVDLASGQTLDPHCFYQHGTPRPFMRLQHEQRGALRVITDGAAIQCQIEHGLYCGLQNSVFRRRVFDRLTFEAASRNEAEDQVFAIRALAAGFRLSYFDAVHVRYHIHGANSSAPGSSMSLEKRRRVYEPLVAGYQRLEQEVPLSPAERRALHRRVANDLFWQIGYNGYWAHHERRAALRVFRQALRWWPWDLHFWKTYLLAAGRTAASATR